jgi:hypothetical protein
MLNIKPPAGMAECPHCDAGFNGVDESGRGYSCYACGESGWMPAASVAAHWRDVAWNAYVAAEKAIVLRVELGIPEGYGYYYDDESGEMVLVPPRGARALAPAAAPALAEEFDDIPF